MYIHIYIYIYIYHRHTYALSAGRARPGACRRHDRLCRGRGSRGCLSGESMYVCMYVYIYIYIYIHI